MVPEQGQASGITIDPEVVVMSLYASYEGGVLHRNWQVPIAPAPLISSINGPSQSRTPRFACHLPSTSSGSPPIKSKSEKVYGPLPFPFLLTQQWSPEGNQPGLVQMEAQAKPPHSLAQHIHHTLRVILPLEADYKIIRIADKLHLSSQPWLNLVLEPPIEHVVKIDVAKKRRKHRALGGS